MNFILLKRKTPFLTILIIWTMDNFVLTARNSYYDKEDDKNFMNDKDLTDKVY